MSKKSNIISGERFSVLYQIFAENEKDGYAKAKDICLEQTVEFPYDLLPEGFICDSIIGRIESFKSYDTTSFETTISYAIETTAFEPTQLLNVIFGNISIKPGIRVKHIDLSESLLSLFKGPRFGKEGIRDLLRVIDRPLLCAPIKPMGMPAKDLADLAYRFALGGIDIIKDDHGLTDQAFARFEERICLCSGAVSRANRETGQNCIYAANITSPSDKIMERAKTAKRYGAGAIMIAPGIVGLDAMRRLADDDDIGLPILSHPALQGSYVINKESGISHGVLFGQIARLFGADAVIYPNFGGRFSFSREECHDIIDGTAISMGRIKEIFPCPGGGMELDRIPDLLDFYGKDVIFLIGGGLFRIGTDLVENCHYLRRLVEK